MFEDYAEKIRQWLKEEDFKFIERPDIETKTNNRYHRGLHLLVIHFLLSVLEDFN
jgi:hypothetical protein